METGICSLALIPGKKEPSDKAEMVTELLFGEVYEVLQEEAKWLLIRNNADLYECWIDRKQHLSCDFSVIPNLELSRRVFEWIKDEISQSVFPVPLGSRIPKQGEILEIGKHLFSRVKLDPEIPENSIIALAKSLLNSPYRWGGKSPMGIDCSGFVQIVMSLNNINLPRDAYQQAEIGEMVPFIEQAQTGDLAFFDNLDGKITHVGLVIGRNEKAMDIIHASGKVRIDTLDHIGIYNLDTGVYTHQLRLIKRVI